MLETRTKGSRQSKIEKEQTVTRKAPPTNQSIIFFMQWDFFGFYTLTGTVNGKEATLLLDTGAEMNLIPEEWISNDRLDGRYVMVNGPEGVKLQ